MSTLPVWAPPLRSRLALFLFHMRHLGDGLCHAYAEYEGMDCGRPKGHERHDDGHHGDVSP